MELTNNLKASYLNSQITKSVNPKLKGVGFHLPVVGINELLRQYHSLPTPIKLLAEPQILANIKDIIRDSKLKKLPNHIVIRDKYVNEYIKIITIINEIGNHRYLERLNSHLTSLEFVKGLKREIKKIISNDEIKLESCYTVLDEMLLFVLEFLYHTGYTKQLLYTKVQNILSQEENEINATVKILEHFINLCERKNNKSSEISIKISRSLGEEITNSITSLLKMYINNFENKHTIKGISSKKLNKSTTLINISIITCDIENTTLIATKLQKYLWDLLNHLNIKRTYLRVLVGNKQLPENSFAVESFNIKYFSQFIKTCNTEKLSDSQKFFIEKIVEWTNFPINDSNKIYGFLSLWSILEFLLVESTEENKIDTIVKNFKPYLAIFYFRKNIKDFLLDVIFRLNKRNSQEESINKLEAYIDSKISPHITNLTDYNLIEKFTMFIFMKNGTLKSPETKWSDFKGELKEDYVFILAKFTVLIDEKPQDQLQKFEKIIEKDLRQMYRLRNMLTHSGEIDDYILENTFYRLRYYVQTLVNSISYNWLIKDSYDIYEIHELKKVDYSQFFALSNKIPNIIKGDATQATKLCVFNNSFLKYPPFKFKIDV